MEHFIVTMLAKSGEEAKVASYYQRIGKDIEAAEGFLGRTVMCSVPGSMAEDVNKRITAEQRAEHPPHDDEQSAQFIIHERWESKEARWAFSSNLNIDRKAELFPYILSAHTHEYYVDALNQ
jgi:heme-degrading monooxygenase HmoA